jgi:hypothetical protein
MHHIVSAFCLVEAQTNGASIRKPLAMGYMCTHASCILRKRRFHVGHLLAKAAWYSDTVSVNLKIL